MPTLTELGFPGADVPIMVLALGARRHTEGDPREDQRPDDRDRQVRRHEAADGVRRAIAPVPQTMDELVKDMADSVKVNAELIKAANIKLE